MKYRVWVVSLCITVFSVYAKPGQPGAIREVGDTVTEMSTPEPVLNESADSVERIGSPLEAQAGRDSITQSGDTLALRIDSLRAQARALRESRERLEFRRADFAAQIERTKARREKTAAEISAYSGSADDEYVKERKELIEKHGVTIADLERITDSLKAEVDAVEAQADAYDAHARELEQPGSVDAPAAKAPDTRPLIRRYPFAFGYQCHYTSAADGPDRYAIRMAGFELSYALRQYAIIGVRDIMLFFNSTVLGDRMALSLAPFIGASVFPLRRVEFHGALGAHMQVQAFGPGGDDVSVAPYVSLGANVWPLKRFSIGPVVRVCYLASGSHYAGAVPSDRADVLSQGAVWLDVGLSYTIHF